MSFFEDASLVLIPSGYKNQKVYSVKPTDGTGDLTFSRASSASRIGPNGLIEKVRTNIALYSEQFNDASWSKATLTVSANAATAPNGTTTADLIYPSANSSNSVIFNGVTITSGVEYTNSVYVKASGKTWTFIRGINDGVGAFFDLSTGVVGSVGSGVTATITSIGSGWYRCSVTQTSTSTTGRLVILVVDGNGSTAVTANGTDGLLIWGGQQEAGVMTDYIATTTAAVSVGPVSGLPRLDYLGSTCPRLLLEPAATAFNTNSENAAGWNVIGSVVTSNATTAPDGYNGGDLVTYAATGARIQQDVIFTDTKATLSVFVKGNSGNGVTILIRNVTTSTNIADNYFNGNTFTPQSGNYSATSTSYGNGWYRVSITVTSGITSGNTIRGYVYTDSTSGVTSGSSVYVWGMNLTNTSYLQSYIPTLGASVTRVADAASKTGISSLIGQTEGTLFVEYDQNLIGQLSTRRIMALSDGSATNRITIYINAGTNKIDFYVRNASGDLFLGTAATAGNATGIHKIAAAYKNGDYAAYMDGVQIISGAGTAGTIPACSRLDLGNQLGAADLYEPMMQALLFKTRLTNAQLAELTTL